MKRQVPKMTTDEEAEGFLDADLSDLDFTQFKPVKFDLSKETAAPRARSRPVAADFLKPGTPAPRSGVYEQRGLRGGHTCLEADSPRGKPLPPAPSGRTWTLVGPRRTEDPKGSKTRGKGKR